MSATLPVEASDPALTLSHSLPAYCPLLPPTLPCPALPSVALFVVLSSSSCSALACLQLVVEDKDLTDALVRTFLDGRQRRQGLTQRDKLQVSGWATASR